MKNVSKSPRRIAYEAITHIEAGGGYSNLVLDKACAGLSHRDRSFVSLLTYGVVERKLTLDAALQAYSSTPPEKMTGDVKNVLRMGLYQLLYMESVPDHAAVSESVALMKTLGGGRKSGFVNGVLRSFLRGEKRFPVPKRELDFPGYCQVAYSCPAPLAAMWEEMYGREATEAILRDALDKPPTYIRVNPLKTDAEALLTALEAEGAVCEKDTLVPGCIRILSHPGLKASPLLANGHFTIQDKASQLDCLAVGAKPGQLVLDLCSAPGGKAFTMGEDMGNTGQIFAFDQYEKRLRLIEKGAARLGLTNIKTGINDAGKYNDQLPLADIVLCDAICSGLGTVRKKPEIKYKSLAELATLPEIQCNILKNAANYVKIGGKLVYSTCTLNRHENDEVVSAFLEGAPGFAPLPLGEKFAPFGAAESHMATLLPHVAGTDGFFIATMQRMW